MSDSWQLHGLQHARPPCPSPAPRAYSNSCPLKRWCHPTISSSVVPFSSHLQSFPVSWSFQMSQFFASGGQSIGVSASASVSLMIFRTGFLYDGLVGSPCSPRDSRVFSITTVHKHQFFSTQLSLCSNSHNPYTTTGKTKALTRRTFVGKVMSLLFNMLSRLVMTFLPRSKRLLISWLQSPSSVTLGAQENTVCHCFHCSPICLLGGFGCAESLLVHSDFL